MLSLYQSGAGLLYRISAGHKLLTLAGAGMIAFSIHNWPAMLALTLLCLLPYTRLHAGWRQLALVLPLWPLLLALAGYHLLIEDIAGGATVLLRLLAMIWLANLFALTTRMEDILNTFTLLFSPLQHIGLNPDAIALSIALCLRLLPVVLQQWRQLDEAWRARGGKRGRWPLLIPLFVHCATLAERLGESLSARGHLARTTRQR